ncbi:MAG: CehA/McbA family metallohydrolase [Phycisphaerales bacterium]|nr:CehA/McbA family metallohydrolase [Phycisphaerales bacterium]
MPVTLQNPYVRRPNTSYRWLKGNLHAHSTRSDGTRSPQKVLDLYAALGHDFAALSDHDILSDYTGLNPHHMILLPGSNEVSSFGNHLLQIGSTAIAHPHENRQRVIDDILATGGLAIINHPNWEAHWNHCPYELLQKLLGYHGLEIFNGVCLDLEGSAYAIDKWERLLSEGRIVWGFANDDSHRDNQEGRGWNVAQVPTHESQNPAAILAALKSGNFYASTGVTIDAIEVIGSTLHITAKDAQEIELYGDHAVRLAVSKSNEITFDAANANATYLRAQLYGQGSAMAWTQPFVIKGGIAEGRRLMEEKYANFDAPRPTLIAHRVSSIPALSSAELETLWQKATESLVAFNHRDGSPPPVKTAIRALVSDQHLAFRIDCEEPLMHKMRVKTPPGPGNGAMWTEDSIELFLDTEASRKRYFKMLINTNGAFHVTDLQGWSRNLKAQTIFAHTPTSWSIQLLLDLPPLLPNQPIPPGPPPGTRFGFHLSRTRLAEADPNKKHDGQVFMWAWVGSSNHAPSRYGWLQL